MEWPGELSTARRAARDGPLSALFSWMGGFSTDAGFEGGGISEREMRRIRAKQIDAVTRLVPITMTVNLVNVGIVLGVFWDAGSKLFLSVWALAVASAAFLAVRSYGCVRAAPARRQPPRAPPEGWR